jgi:hypothetical protein
MNRKTYQSWRDMIRRCTDPKNKNYDRYGGRGIKVCQRWLDSFANFLADMGEAPEGMTLERSDNDVDYSPANCRWASREEQQRNTKTTKFYEFNGISLCVRAWEEKLGLSRGALCHRLQKGWPVEKALSTPNLGRNRP